VVRSSFLCGPIDLTHSNLAEGLPYHVRLPDFPTWPSLTTLPESNRSSTVYYRHVSCCTLGKPSVTTGQRLSCHSGGAPRSNKMYVVWNTYQNFSVSVVGRTLRRGESQDRHWICSHWDMSPLRIVQFHSLVEMGLGYMERLGLQCLFVEYRTMCSLVEVLQKERVTLGNCKWLPMKI
jgi:hypothetical protein